MKKIWLLNLFVLFSMGAKFAYGQNVTPILQSITDTSVNIGDTIALEDDKYLTRSTIDTDLSVDDYVIFELDESSPKYLAYPLTYTIFFDIQYYDSTGTSLGTLSDSLRIHYDTAMYSKFAFKQSYHFKGGYKFKVTVSNVHFYGVGYSSTPHVFNLTGEIIIDRKYKFNCSSYPSPTDTVNTTNHQQAYISWGTVAGAEEYDLEYTFYDDSSSAVKFLRAVSGNSLIYNGLFLNNCTRITTTNASYNLNLVYPPGIVFYRVRSAHYTFDGRRLVSKWSNEAWFALSGFSSYIDITSTLAHQPTLNWQYQAVFAEEGKNSQSIKYFDGSLRERENEVLSNANQTSIVGQTIYDFQGRPALKVLPVPTFDNELKFYHQFNQFDGTHSYSRVNFDTGSCGFVPGAMTTNSGSANYYSSNNPLKDTKPFSYIPSAGGYPFSVTEWTPDNTGRVQRQSGVGPTFALSNGRETKYYYGKPLQNELDRLFGSEVGNASHYLKNMVMDPDSQISVSYIDAHGRTIATALAGKCPNNLQRLAFDTGASIVTYSILADTQTVISPSVISTQALLVDTRGNETFDYSLTSGQYKPGCVDTGVCYDCLYDLNITISNNCEVLASLNKKNYIIPNPEQFDTICGDTVPHIYADTSIFLETGSYNITKTLSVSSDALNYYENLYLGQARCLKTFSNFLAGFLANTNFSGCNMDCNTCKAQLGRKDTFVVKFIRNITSQGNKAVASDSANASTLYDQMLAQCSTLCSMDGEDGILYDQMKMDMSPGGQYMQYVYDSVTQLLKIPTADSTFNKAGANVLFALNDTWFGVSYQSSKITYTDGHGKLDSIFSLSLGKVVPPNQLTVSEFLGSFKSVWADSLVKFHPEYGYYLWLKKNIASQNYDDSMLAVGSYDTARAKGYINPLGSDSVKYKILKKDPFFQPGGLGAAYYKNMNYDMFHIRPDTPVSIWAYAYLAVYCTDPTGLSCTVDTLGDGGCGADRDMEWLNFQTMYIAKKSVYVDMAKRQYAISNGFLNDVIGDGHRTESPAASISNIHGMPKENSSNVTYNVFWNRLKRVVPANTTSSPGQVQPQSQAQALSMMGGGVDSNCVAQAAEWMVQLQDCISAHHADSARLRNTLIAICEAGGDSIHPNGSSNAPNGVKVPGDPYTYYTFENAITHILGVSSTDSMCNAYLISFPATYANPVQQANQPLYRRPDNCTCTKINAIYSEYEAFHGMDTSYAQFLHEHYQSMLSVAQVSEIMGMCNGTNNCRFVGGVIDIPTALSCGGCATCTEIDTLVLKFYNLMPGVSHMRNFQTMLTNYLNGQLGYAKTYQEYHDFMVECSHDTSYVDSILHVGITADTVCHKADLSISEQELSWITTFNGSVSGLTSAQYADSLTRYLNHHMGFTSLTFANYYQFFTHMYSPSLVGWGSSLATIAATPTAPALLTLINAYNNAHTGAPFTPGNGNGLTNYLNTTTGTGLTFSQYQGIMTATFGANLTNVLTGIKWNAKDTITCTALTDTLNNMSLSTMYSADSLNFFDEVTGALNKKLGLNFSICGYFNILQQCHNNAAIKTLLAGHLPVCDSITSDTAYCARLNSYIVHFNHTHLGSPVYPGYGFELTAYLDSSIYHAHNTYQYYYNRLKGCYDSVYVDTLMLNNRPGCYTADSCGALLFYAKGVKGLGLTPGTSNFDTTVTSLYNYFLVQKKSFCTYYTEMVNCVGADSTVPLLGTTPNCSGATTVCTQVLNMVEAFNAPLGNNPPATPGYPLKLANALNTETGWQLTFTEYKAMLATCTTTPTADSTMGRPNYPNDIDSAGPLVCSVTYTSYHFYDIMYGNDSIHLCNDPDADMATVDTNTCMEQLMNIAYTNAKEAFKHYQDSILNDFAGKYLSKCLHTIEKFKVTMPTNEYHYTLYYYDQAGNLTKTIPPDSVRPITLQATLDSIDSLRHNPLIWNPIFPKHKLQTRYWYNTLNAVVQQNTPDGGTSNFWYDRLGRLAVSQNAQQKVSNSYSYTLYDFLGRITEVGQLTQTTAMTDAISRNDASLHSWIAGGASRQQVTRTFYDIAPFNITAFGTNGQQNLRNRVVSVIFQQTYNSDSTKYNTATHYSYDIEGNVVSLINENDALKNIGKQFKILSYDFDLVSKKVNYVYYQKDSVDQFIHHYEYDADNKLVDVQTSRDNLVWETDAVYKYYMHGPLSRMELGDRQVQGIDYAYTLQGWLKAINGTAIDSTVDMGADGGSGAHSVFPKDVYATALNYFSGDYSPISSAFKNPEAAYSGSDLDGGSPGLYNGNIRNTTVALSKFNSGTPLGNAYKYDQLSRYLSMDVYNNLNTSTNTWGSAGGPIADYKERVSYDANGNILSYLRHGASSIHTDMDSMTYNYKPNTNQLTSVNDGVSASNYPNDIDNEVANNYRYDNIGNLIRDSIEGLHIYWNVYGKVDSIYNDKKDLAIRFLYDPTGNRVLKRVRKSVSTTDTINTTYYVRDVQGNIMATYLERSDSLWWQDNSIYGSARVGEYHADSLVYPHVASTDTSHSSYVEGLKEFELTNHLGNVLATVSDRKIAHNNSGTIDLYHAVVLTQNDYYPFGMQEPGRTFTVNSIAGYRFGFNGKLKDNDIEGDGNSYDFGARIYSSLIGRWLSIDPSQRKYASYTPYSFGLNNPLNQLDPDGREVIPSPQFQASWLYPIFETFQSNSIFNKYISAFSGAMSPNLTIDYKNPPPGLEDGSPGGVHAWTANTNRSNSQDIIYSTSYFYKGKNIDNAGILATTIHELIHTKLNNARNTSKDLAKDYPGYSSYIKTFGENDKGPERDWQHNWMADYGRKDIIASLKEYDQAKGVNRTSEFGEYSSDDWYEAVSWGGLEGTRAWNKLSSDKKSLYTGILADEFAKLPAVTIIAPKKDTSKSNKTKTDSTK